MDIIIKGLQEYLEWCEANGLQPKYASSLNRYYETVKQGKEEKSMELENKNLEEVFSESDFRTEDVQSLRVANRFGELSYEIVIDGVEYHVTVECYKNAVQNNHKYIRLDHYCEPDDFCYCLVKHFTYILQVK